MKILLVEDNEEKAEAVRSGLVEALPGIAISITTAPHAAAARKALRDEQYDLMILDVALPNMEGEEPTRTGGVDLLKEIMERGIYRRPTHVIGLTAFTDVYELASVTFDAELWSLVYFDSASDVWLERIASKVRHIAVTRVDVVTGAERIDICIVVAVPDELAQMRGNGWTWHPHDVTGDATLYFSADYTRKSGEPGRAILAKTPIMGMSAASILATKMAMHFKPRCIVMPGICAGDSGQVQLGDLIAGNPVWDYGSGKHVSSPKKGERFEPAPFQIGLSSKLRGMLERLGEDAAFFSDVHTSFPGAKPVAPSRLHVGPFASGAAVLANRGLFAQIQEGQHRKLTGIDMEAYGVMSAASEAPLPAIDSFVLKGVADFADADKDDRFRHYAAHLSAKAVTRLCELFDV